MNRRFASTVLSLFVLPFTVHAEMIYSDEATKCGDDCAWALNTETGELTISGTGRMYDYGYYCGGPCVNYYTTPWGNENITSVTINQGIEYIGISAFHADDRGGTIKHYNLKSISIPDSVTSIGAAAFSGNFGLETLEIPDSVTDIGTSLLYTTGIKKLIIPDSLEEIESNGLAGNSATIYCKKPQTGTSSICAGKGSNNITYYEKDENGVYSVNGIYYASPDDMIAQISCGANDMGDGPSDLCKTKAAEYKLQKAESMAGGALCKSKQGCLQLLNMAQEKEYCTTIASCKAYGKEHGISFGNYAVQEKDGSYTLYDEYDNIIGYRGKRIYTLEEAARVVQTFEGSTARFSVRYR